MEDLGGASSEPRFWGRRFIAYVIDQFVVYGILTAGTAAGLSFIPAIWVENVVTDGLVLSHLSYAYIGVFVLTGWLYAGFLETTILSASLGKAMLGLRVIDMNGERLSFWRSMARQICVVLLFIYFIFILLERSLFRIGYSDTLKKLPQDVLTHTSVVRRL